MGGQVKLIALLLILLNQQFLKMGKSLDLVKPDHEVGYRHLKNQLPLIHYYLLRQILTVDQHYHMFEESEKGSVLCYPIYHRPSRSYPYVLCIKASKVNYFTAGREDYYKWLYD